MVHRWPWPDSRARSSTWGSSWRSSASASSTPSATSTTTRARPASCGPSHTSRCSPWRRTRWAFPSCLAAGGRRGSPASAHVPPPHSASRSRSSSRTACCSHGSSCSVPRCCLVPWFVLCATLARHARTRAEDRERLVFVGRLDEGQLLRDELAGRPERPAELAKVLTCAEARSTGSGPPLIAAAAEANATLVVLDREAQADEHIVAQAALLHERGAGAYRVALLRAVARARSRSGSSSGSRSCSTSARCTVTATAG